MKKILLILFLISLCLRIYAKVPKLEIYDGIKINPKQYEEIKALAKKEYDGVIKKIYIGKLFFPGPVIMGARVYFEDEAIDTYAISRSVTIGFPLSDAQSDQQQLQLKKKYARLLGLKVRIKRVFRLKKHTLHLNVPDKTSYQQVKTILQAVEQNDFSKGKNIELKKPIDLTKIEWVESFDLTELKLGKTIGFVIMNNRTEGTVYYFQIEGNKVLLVYKGCIIS